jgi:hypothetical protein
MPPLQKGPTSHLTKVTERSEIVTNKIRVDAQVSFRNFLKISALLFFASLDFIDFSSRIGVT